VELPTDVFSPPPDLLFLENTEVIFRVALALLGEHKDGLLTCDSFEEIMEYLKNVVPTVDQKILDRVMKQVCKGAH
jgi:hypothetical protein